MLSVTWFLGWALRDYLQVNRPARSPTTNGAGAADDSGGNGRLRAKAQVAQLSSPSAARHVISPRTSPTSTVAPSTITATSTTTTSSKGPYPVNTQPLVPKTSQTTRSAAPPSPTPLTRSANTPTSSPKPPSTPTSAAKRRGREGADTLVSTKTITLKMSPEWVERQLDKFRFSFNEADRDRNGFLSFDEVLQVMTKNGFRGSRQQAKELFSQLDVNNDQKLTREEFSAAMDRLPRNTIRELSLRQTFQRMDKDGSGKLSRSEIERAANSEGGMDVPAEKIAQLLKMLSKDKKDQAVDYEEFLQVFGVHCTADVMQQVFQGLDTDHSGFLTKQEIMAAIQSQDELKLRAAKIADLLIAWHKDDDQKINYREFVQVWTRYKDH